MIEFAQALAIVVPRSIFSAREGRLPMSNKVFSENSGRERGDLPKIKYLVVGFKHPMPLSRKRALENDRTPVQSERSFFNISLTHTADWFVFHHGPDPRKYLMNSTVSNDSNEISASNHALWLMSSETIHFSVCSFSRLCQGRTRARYITVRYNCTHRHHTDTL